MKKFLKISGISLLVLLLLLIAAPFLFKGKIINLIKTEANKNLNATLNFNDDISLSLIKNFPKLSIGINELSILGKDTFKGDTLIYLPKFKATLDIMSVIKGEKIEINSIALEQPYINLMVLENGKANYDIVITDTTKIDRDTSASKFNLALSKLTINDGRLNYEDKTLPFNTSLKHFNHELKGDFTVDNFVMKTTTDAQELTLGYGGINYLYKVATDIKANIQMDMKNMKFTFSDNDILLNQLNLLGEGFVDMNENDMDFDLKFKSKKTDFKTILSLVPGMYSSSFDKAKASGKLDFGGYFKGKMTETAMPGYGLKLNVDNGFFQYPDLPKSLNNVFVNLAVDNPTGIANNMVIDLSKFNANIAGEPISAKLLVKTPTSDPYLDGALKGNINLSEFRSFIPLEPSTEISGLIKSDVTFNGKVSTLQNNATNFNAGGNIIAQNFHYKDPENLKQGTNLNSEISFNPKTVDIKSFLGNVGMSDFDAKGSISNLFGYIMNNELLKGNFTFNSNYFNANEFLTDETVKKEPTASDSIPLQAFEVPANLDLALNSKINKLIYDNLTLTDLGGVVRLKDQLMFFDNVGVNLLGGSMNLNGEYNSSNPKFPFSQVDFKVKSLDIIQTFNYLDMVQKLAPIAKYTQGLFNANIQLANNFKQDLSVDYPTVSGTLQMGISEAALKNLPVLNIIAEKLKIDKLKNLSIK
ncbi:MAG: AsmA family protein, partial [Bacteroidetes bacterium]|nr:AsmA family protein [Bacteroidota bacterium]